MIFGRSISVWMAAVTAILNVLVVVIGISLSVGQLGALNAAAAAILAVLAWPVPASTPTAKV